jgi:hypothetical protein
VNDGRERRFSLINENPQVLRFSGVVVYVTFAIVKGLAERRTGIFRALMTTGLRQRDEYRGCTRTQISTEKTMVQPLDEKLDDNR